jgi:hypothetical protein
MINLEQIEDMTPLDLEKYLNSVISNISYKDTERSNVRAMMIDSVKKIFETDVKIECHKTRSEELTIFTKYFEVIFKVSIKSTGKMKAITKHRNADIMCPNKFTFDNILFKISFPRFIRDDLKKITIKIDPKWVHTNFYYFNEKKLTFKELKNPEFIRNVVDKKGDRNLEEDTIISMIQPLYSDIYHKISSLPIQYQERLKNDTNSWDELKKITKEVNQELLNQVINDVLILKQIE